MDVSGSNCKLVEQNKQLCQFEIDTLISQKKWTDSWAPYFMVHMIYMATQHCNETVSQDDYKINNK